MSTKKLVSIITPVFNEEKVIEWYYNTITGAIDKLSDKYEGKYEFEIVITDNCSTDKTFEIIKTLSNKDSRIRAFKFSRNFGYQKSILTAYKMSRGDCAVQFDVDLQDPPEYLETMLKLWEENNKIVYGIRTKRKEGFVVTKLREIFYFVMNKIADHDIPRNVGDFMLLDRTIINLISKVKQKSPYLRGIIFSYGFKKVGFEVHRNARCLGDSKFPILKMTKLALDGIVSQSSFPLRLASLFGFSLAFVSCIFGFCILLQKLFFNSSIPRGFTTIALLLSFGFAFNAIFLGIIGEYIARINHQICSDDEVIIEEKINS